MLLINYQVINLKQIVCFAKKISEKRYFASQKPQNFVPAAGSGSFHWCRKTAMHYFLLIRTLKILEKELIYSKNTDESSVD